MKTLLLLPLLISPALAGPYAPAANQPGTTAVANNAPAILRWATRVESYVPGDGVDAAWRDSAQALGPASTNPLAVVSLGRGGSITLGFSALIGDGPGFDFAVFENSFSHTFLELAFVEVSSDGVDFTRFPNRSITPAPVGSFGSIDPTNVDGLAGKYIGGFGTPFDLAVLRGTPGLDVDAVRFVRLVDVIGGTSRDSTGALIYDPFPTTGTAGFDLDGVAVLSDAPLPLRIVAAEIEGDDFRLSWQAVAGRRYRIDASPTLDGDWQPVATQVAAGALESVTVPRAGFPARFFKISEEW